MATSERLFYLVCGTLLIVGSVVFTWGGSMHPPIDARLGPIGSDEFFRSFVRHVLEHDAWERIHGGILAGPVCWALGGVGAALALRERGEARFSVLGAVALAMGATAWAVTFVFDGFVALRIAQTIGVDRASQNAALLPAFEANQVVVIRLGLVSWILVGAGMASLGAAILSVGLRPRVAGWIVGATAVIVGIWPIVAWALGIFEPGPFISKWWALTAVLTAAWFLLLGVALLAQAARGRQPNVQLT
jgi:hypothetical protein